MMAEKLIVRVRDLSLSRGAGARRHPVLRGLGCEIGSGEFVSLVGKSGSGKSTLIGLIAGLLVPDEGLVEFPAGQPRIGIQFQEDALFPWRRVWSNLGYAVEIAGKSVQERRAHATRLSQMVGLAPEVYLDRYPTELSGGERRRLSLAMAISASPSLLLLDEATGSLDWLTRRQIQEMLQNVCVEQRLATLAVTHDVEEAVWLSHRVLVLNHGIIVRDFQIPIPHPRTEETRSRPEFNGLVEEIAQSLSDGKTPPPPEAV